MIIKKLLSYLAFWKKQEAPEGAEKSKYLKMMHGINKLSILIFVVAMIILAIRLFK